MKERIIKAIGYLRGATKVWVLVVAIGISVIIGYMARGVFGPGADEAGVSAQQVAREKDKAPQRWTCSMHPQINLPKPGLCPICNMQLIPLETQEEDSSSLRELTVSENAKKLMEIQTAPVERRFVEAEVRMVGKVDYDETRLKYITAWIPGRLDRLYVDYTGVPVNKGDHMVYRYSPELLSAQEELLQALETVKDLERSDIGILREMSEATVIAVREKLRLWGLKPEQIEEIETRGTTSDHMTIYAPSGGIVVHKNAHEGMYVKTGTRIYTIVDLSEVWIRLDAYESDLTWLRYGQKVEFTTEAYPGERFVGTIAFIDPILTQMTRTVKVRVNATNPKMRLKPGMFVRAVARAKVATGAKVMDAALAGKWICPMHPDVVKEGAGKCDICQMPLVRTESLGYLGLGPTKADKPLVIPATAALVTGTRAIVYVEVPGKEKPTFEGREIVLGPRAGDYYLVRHGLTEGERVVTKGNFKLDAELQIRAKPSMMTPEGGGGGGHQHGGPVAGKEDTDSGKMAMRLPPMVQVQLHAVMAAGEEVDNAIEARDLSAIRSGFAALQQKVQAVETQSLQKHMKMLWKEYSMLLTNDAVEGKDAKDLHVAERVAGMMNEHLASMKSNLGLERGDSPPMTSVINPKFRQQLAKAASAYLAIQEALAKDDSKQAVNAAKKMAEAIASVDMTLLQGEDHMVWMKTSGELKNILAGVIQAEGIEPVRKEFALLSEEMGVTVKRFGVAGSSLYQFKCPMAFNNRGATWLQANDKTRNPYFGTAMLQCGEVMEIFLGAEEQGDSDE